MRASVNEGRACTSAHHADTRSDAASAGAFSSLMRITNGVAAMSASVKASPINQPEPLSASMVSIFASSDSRPRIASAFSSSV